MQSNKFSFHSSTYIKFADLDTKKLIHVINHHINSINNPQKLSFPQVIRTQRECE